MALKDSTYYLKYSLEQSVRHDRWTRAVSDDGYSVIYVEGDLRFERPRIVAMTAMLKKAMEIVLKEEEIQAPNLHKE